ncbi:hypothetical protein L1077_15640 [Pseudoalteromonas luteoviolacea]|uniref:hypothetical protein n=1 Tax=Pseudoalteromonas luteoviolacea TaxID=43657 RepID=UPI001F41EA63|nr:hypothetical protein [Pseudoalteromonas luteoviolacea]MCF6440870.1 hypothetical protein [Pseudoalteromonas luteoviolacea]
MQEQFSKRYRLIRSLLKPLRGEWGPGICDEESFNKKHPAKPYLGELSLCILEMQDMYQQFYDNKDDKQNLRNELINIFDADDAHWHGMCSNSELLGDKELEDCEYGFQPSAVSVWEETFSDEIELNSIDSEEEFHIEMLKLMVKRVMWDVLFPGETLPGYSEPTSGDLSLLDYSIME